MDDGSTPIIRIACPSTVIACIDWLLSGIVTLLVKVLAATRSVKGAAATDVALDFLRITRRKLIPLQPCKSRILRKQSSRQEGRCCHPLRERLIAWLRWHHAKVLSRHLVEHAIAITHGLTLTIPATLFLRFFLEEGSNTHTASFRPEMPAKSIRTSEAPATTPIVAILEVAAADKLLLSRVQTLVTLSVVLTGERLTANTTYKWTLICMRAQMRS